MRKALLVVVLIAASFAGGAVVNGPGLRWAQACVLQRMGIGEEKPTEVLSPDAINTTAAAAEPVDEGIPGRPIAPLVLDTPGTADKPKEKTAAAPAEAKAKPDTSAAKGDSPPSPSPIAESKDPLGTPPALEPLEVAQAPPPAPTLAPAPAPLPADPSTERDGAIRQASLPGKTTVAGEDSDSSTTNPLAPAPLNPIPSDWTAVRQAMKSLGVSRYGLEGELGGRVRFHCVIPLAGRRAVGQHFEAEGDDDLQAAQAALKRVALWRATEVDTSPPSRARTP